MLYSIFVIFIYFVKRFGILIFESSNEGGRMKTIYAKVLVIIGVAVLLFLAVKNDKTVSAPSKKLVVSGYGASPENVKNRGQRKLMARTAAIADAYWNLARLVEEVRVSGKTRVVDCITEKHEVWLELEAFIKGAVIVEEEELEDGIFHVVMELPLEGEKGLWHKLATEGIVDTEEPVPPPNPPKQHTGIELRVKMRGINPVAKIYVNSEEIKKYEKSAQYIYYDYTKIYDDDDEHTITLETQTYGYKKYVLYKKKDGEVLLKKELVAKGGYVNQYLCLAEFDFRSLECSNTNPYGF